MTSSSSARSDDRDTLRARLRVRPRSGRTCNVLGSASDGDDVVQSLGCSGDCQTELCECRAEVISEDRASPQFLSKRLDDGCVCPVFRSHRCVPDLRGIEDGELVFSVTIEERSVLRALVADLREVGATVRLQRLVEGGTGDEFDGRGEPLITEKQREAIRTAYDLGYYESPRGADLGEVADELGVSRSAASQRLNAAASTLVVDLLRTGYEPEPDAGPTAAGNA